MAAPPITLIDAPVALANTDTQPPFTLTSDRDFIRFEWKSDEICFDMLWITNNTDVPHGFQAYVPSRTNWKAEAGFHATPYGLRRNNEGYLHPGERAPIYFMLHSKEMPAQNDAHFIVKHIKDVRKEAEAASSFNHLCNLLYLNHLPRIGVWKVPIAIESDTVKLRTPQVKRPLTGHLRPITYIDPPAAIANQDWENAFGLRVQGHLTEPDEYVYFRWFINEPSVANIVIENTSAFPQAIKMENEDKGIFVLHENNDDVRIRLNENNDDVRIRFTFLDPGRRCGFKIKLKPSRGFPAQNPEHFFTVKHRQCTPEEKLAHNVSELKAKEFWRSGGLAKPDGVKKLPVAYESNYVQLLRPAPMPDN